MGFRRVVSTTGLALLLACSSACNNRESELRKIYNSNPNKTYFLGVECLVYNLEVNGGKVKVVIYEDKSRKIGMSVSEADATVVYEKGEVKLYFGKKETTTPEYIKKADELVTRVIREIPQYKKE